MASIVETPSWERGARCNCKGCDLARKQGAEDERAVIMPVFNKMLQDFAEIIAREYSDPHGETIAMYQEKLTDAYKGKTL